MWTLNDVEKTFKSTKATSLRCQISFNERFYTVVVERKRMRVDVEPVNNELKTAIFNRIFSDSAKIKQ